MTLTSTENFIVVLNIEGQVKPILIWFSDHDMAHAVWSNAARTGICQHPSAAGKKLEQARLFSCEHNEMFKRSVP